MVDGVQCKLVPAVCECAVVVVVDFCCIQMPLPSPTRSYAYCDVIIASFWVQFSSPRIALLRKLRQMNIHLFLQSSRQLGRACRDSNHQPPKFIQVHKHFLPWSSGFLFIWSSGFGVQTELVKNTKNICLFCR